MRRIAIINQKGGVGKTTTAVNLGAALARLGQRAVVIDMDPQANASMNLGAELAPEEPSTYSILTQGGRVADTLRGTSTPGLSILPAHLDLSGAELELASAIGRETILKDALDEWIEEEVARTGREPADVILIDNPPSLGLLSVNGLAASQEVLIAVQTEFFALQGLSKLVEIVQLLRRRLNPDLEITGVLACLYDSRLRLGREVLAELRAHFPAVLFKRPIAQNVKLAETPSFARTIFEYAPESKGAEDYMAVAREFLEREGVEEHASGRSIEPPVRATAEPAPVAQPEPPTPETPTKTPRAVEDDAGAGQPAAIGGTEETSEVHDETAALMLDIAKVLASPRKGLAHGSPVPAAEADAPGLDGEAPENGLEERACPPTSEERTETSEAEAPEQTGRPVDVEAVEGAAESVEEELVAVVLTPVAAHDPSVEEPEQGGPEDVPREQVGAGSAPEAPAASADGAAVARAGPAVAVLVEPEETPSDVCGPGSEAAEVVEEDAAPEPAEEPVRHLTPVAATRPDRGEEHALLPGRRGFTSDPLG
ncbi:MAG: AAA family ATPase [Planctomycetota bacterium]|nr:AAA family ATPase [Planctomycetota bacterium]